MLDDALLVKVKVIALGTRMSGGVINRKRLISIKNGVICANNLEMLKELGVTIELTESWTKGFEKSE